MSKVAIGIIGGGGILDAHAPALAQNSERCEVRCIAEKRTDPQTVSRIRTLLGENVRIHPDYQRMLEEEQLEAVDIILPHDLHLRATIDAARAGKHVLVEKVMARNIDECRQMLEACDRAGVSLVVAHDRRYNPEWEVLKKIIDSGVLGELLFFKLEHNQNVIFPEGSWIRTRDGIGGGAIMSCLTHQIDALRWYGGEIREVCCMSKVRPERMEGEVIGLIGAKMASGALAQLSLNWWTTSHRSKGGLWYELTHVCGTEGEAYSMSERGTYLKVHDESDKRLFEYALDETDRGFEKMEPDDSRAGHERLIGEWLRYLRNEPNRVSTFGADALKTVEVAEAAYRAEKLGRYVTLPIEPEPWS